MSSIAREIKAEVQLEKGEIAVKTITDLANQANKGSVFAVSPTDRDDAQEAMTFIKTQSVEAQRAFLAAPRVVFVLSYLGEAENVINLLKDQPTKAQEAILATDDAYPSLKRSSRGLMVNAITQKLANDEIAGEWESFARERKILRRAKAPVPGLT
jgi:hypothetical protein